MKRKELFFKHLAQTSDTPLAIEADRAEGIYIWSGEKRYIDCISGIAVSNTGHSKKEITDAVINQLHKHLHLMVYGELIQDSQVKLASMLAQLLPPSLSVSYFVNSGSEAVEAAMKLSKRYTGRSRFTALFNAYHGSTQGALSLMSEPEFSRPFMPLLPGIKFQQQNETEGLIHSIDKDTAAVFIEPVMGEKGYIPCTKEFLNAVRKRCDETGALLVFDEIQTAIGRTGELFAFEKFGVVPDVLLLTKSLGGGLPLGAFISSPEIMGSLKNDPVLGHISTFGGHPLSCASAYASLGIITQQNLHKTVEEKEKLFRSLLVHKEITALDGCGLMLSIRLKNKDLCKEIINACISDGLLIDWFLFAEDRIRLAPPLCVSFEEIKTICGIILENIDACTQPKG